VEDLKERTFRFATRVVNLCRVLDETPGVSRTLANQLLRSGTSIGANVEEGQASESKADFVSKYSIACKESLLASAAHCVGSDAGSPPVRTDRRIEPACRHLDDDRQDGSKCDE